MSNLLMNVVAVAVDQSNNTPIVILRDVDNRFAIPIWIGLLEASAIQIELQRITIPRPMTHDLFKSAIEQLGARIESIVVCDLREDTFYATVNVAHDGRTHALDARPSDAIALALRFRAPIFVDERVAREAHRPELLERLREKRSETAAADPASAEADSTAPSESAEVRQIIEQLESGQEPKWKA